jgi:hypothetical protein
MRYEAVMLPFEMRMRPRLEAVGKGSYLEAPAFAQSIACSSPVWCALGNTITIFGV